MTLEQLLANARHHFPGMSWEWDEDCKELQVFAMLGVSGVLFLRPTSAVLRDGFYGAGSWSWAKRKLRMLCDEMDAYASLEPRESLERRIAALEQAAKVPRRRPGTVAADPDTGNQWVCIGGSDAQGWQWAWVGPKGGTIYALELQEQPPTHPSLGRALKQLEEGA